MGLEMSLQLVFSHEGFIALVAREWPLPSVLHHVARLVYVVDECPITFGEAARIRTDVGMDSLKY